MGDNLNGNILGGDLQAEPTEVEIKETDAAIDEAWRKSNLLTFDGGGIRGYWSLLALNKLMSLIAVIEHELDEDCYHSFHPLTWPGDVSQLPLDESEIQEKNNLKPPHRQDTCRVLNKNKRFLPCHYFDYMGGSSTGGLISIMLGRLRMTVPDCMDEYERLGEKVFGSPRSFTELNFAFTKRTKYDAKNLKKIYQSVTERRGEKTKKRAAPTFETNSHTCRCFVTTLRSVFDRAGVPSRADPYLIRSYKCKEPADSQQLSRGSTLIQPSRANSNNILHGESARKWPRTVINDGDAHDYEIWEVARAATAARYFFDPIEIHDRGRGKKMLFEDGGLGHSINPTNYGVSDIRTRHGADSVGIVVSVGTARGDLGKHKDPFRFKRKMMQTVEIASDPQSIHNLIVEQARAEPGFDYYRINPDDKTDEYLLNMPFDQWLPRHSLKQDKSGSTTIQTIKTAFNSWWSNEPGVSDSFEECARKLVAQRRLRMADRNKWERYAMATAFECQQKHCNRQDRTWTDVFEFEQHLKVKHGLQGAALVAEKNNASNPWRYREVTNNDRQEQSTRKRLIRFS